MRGRHIVEHHHKEWIEDTMTTGEMPWLEVICAMVGKATGMVSNSATPTSGRDAGSGTPESDYSLKRSLCDPVRTRSNALASTR